MVQVGTRTSQLLLVAGLLTVLSVPANAASTFLKFYKGGTGYSDAYSGAGTVYDNTKSLATDCPTSPVGCSGDNVATPMTFTGVTATAGPTGKSVWNDLSPNFGGLGVGTGDPSDTDQIAGTDVLTLTFPTEVKLTGVGTLFASAHTTFGAGFATAASIVASASTIAFDLAVDAGAFSSVKFADANAIALGLVGTAFHFRQISGNPEYYVSALAFETCAPGGSSCAPPPGVPIPGALPLFASGLGMLGLLGWRRRKSPTTV